MQTFRWGILGTGAIAGKFAEGLEALDDASLAAVGSRSEDSARAFADAHSGSSGPARAHGSYEALAADPEIDAIYVATPHALHRENTLMCLDAGKHVLCEKPLAIHSAEGAEMVARARERGLFLMEAMWTRCQPPIVRLREMLAEERLGEVRQLVCDFGFRAELDPQSRLFDPNLGGGALLDVGVYCVALAHLVFGKPPAEIASVAHIGESGVDENCAWNFRYEDGAMALMSAAIRMDTPQEAVIVGTTGHVRIPRFWCPDRLIVNEKEERFEILGNGYSYEAREVADCIRAGRLESDKIPLDESLAILESMDRVRAPWALRYPADGPG